MSPGCVGRTRAFTVPWRVLQDCQAPTRVPQQLCSSVRMFFGRRRGRGWDNAGQAGGEQQWGVGRSP